MSRLSSLGSFTLLLCIGIAMMAALGIYVAIGLSRLGEVFAAITVLFVDAFMIAANIFIMSLVSGDD